MARLPPCYARFQQKRSGPHVFVISRETPDDWWEVEALFDLCFAPGREALSSYRLRDEVDPVANLCRVARDPDGVLAGAIRVWPVRAGGAPTLLLGPIAVHPTRQSEGLGGALIRDVIESAQGWDRAMLVGDAPYYARFGFQRLPDVHMPPPTNPDRVLGLEILPDAWRGIAGRVTKAE